MLSQKSPNIEVWEMNSLAIARIKKQFGFNILDVLSTKGGYNKLQILENEGLVSLIGGQIKLTDEGLAKADGIIRNLLS